VCIRDAAVLRVVICNRKHGLVTEFHHGRLLPRKSFFLRFNEIAPCYPDGGAEKRVSERKLRLEEAPGARKRLFRAADQPRWLRIYFLQKYRPGGINSFFQKFETRNP
ncbi:MAG: hypothetical protein KGY42_05560, partial [Desulfobacterales bacterium]|nr:hypothetical protein [Desulfobacterales bacterium]